MFSYEEKKDNFQDVMMTDYNNNEDKENVGLYSNMQVSYDKENVQYTQINKFNSIQSIPINSKQRYTTEMPL